MKLPSAKRLSSRLAAGLCAGVLVLSAAPALSQETVVLDYRDQAFLMGQPFYSQPERRQIAAALKKAPGELSQEMGTDFAVLGDVEGAFTKADADQHLYLVQAAAPVAIEPFPDAPAPVLLVTEGGRFAASYRLPKEVQYQRLVAAADGDGDGRDEVLLEAAFMNMGEALTTVDVVELGTEGAARTRQQLQSVYDDSCETGAGEKKRTASTVSIEGGRFVARAYDVGCGD